MADTPKERDWFAVGLHTFVVVAIAFSVLGTMTTFWDLISSHTETVTATVIRKWGGFPPPNTVLFQEIEVELEGHIHKLQYPVDQWTIVQPGQTIQVTREVGGLLGLKRIIEPQPVPGYMR